MEYKSLTFADVQPETGEHAYRRGYRDAMMRASDLVVELWFMRTPLRIQTALYYFAWNDLSEWLDQAAYDNRLVTPPPFPGGAMCSYCKRRPGVHMDHVIPRSRGGSDLDNNLAPACQRCNLEKRARTPEEWTDRWYERDKTE